MSLCVIIKMLIPFFILILFDQSFCVVSTDDVKDDVTYVTLLNVTDDVMTVARLEKCPERCVCSPVVVNCMFLNITDVSPVLRTIPQSVEIL